MALTTKQDVHAELHVLGGAQRRFVNA